MDITTHFLLDEDNKDKIDVIKEWYNITVCRKKFHKNVGKHDTRTNCPICNTILVDANEHKCHRVEVPDGSSINWTTVDAEAEERHNEWLGSDDIYCDFDTSVICSCKERAKLK
jgi:hypothetical protein